MLDTLFPIICLAVVGLLVAYYHAQKTGKREGVKAGMINQVEYHFRNHPQKKAELLQKIKAGEMDVEGLIEEIRAEFGGDSQKAGNGN